MGVEITKKNQRNLKKEKGIKGPSRRGNQPTARTEARLAGLRMHERGNDLVRGPRVWPCAPPPHCCGRARLPQELPQVPGGRKPVGMRWGSEQPPSLPQIDFPDR